MSNPNDTVILAPKDVFDDEWIAVISYNETSEEFEERIISLVQARMDKGKGEL